MADQKINFSDSFEELREINRWFHSEDIDLDEGLKKLRRGQELIKQCQKRLEDVENEFKEIKLEYEMELDSNSSTTTQNVDKHTDVRTNIVESSQEDPDSIPL